MEEIDQTLKLKRLFAARLMQIDRDNSQEVFKVATEFCGTDYGAALRMTKDWPQDPDVIEECVRIGNSGVTVDEREKLKKEAIDILMKIARDDKKFTEDRIKALKEVGVISGIVQENKTNINVNNNTLNVTQNRVMVVKDHGSDEDWELAALQQQERLVNESTATTIH